uniref:Uncharacterized protein n=1 Tax=Arundo donax TaxID=35708 RepID=A0A0A9GKD2_ARUDO
MMFYIYHLGFDILVVQLFFTGKHRTLDNQGGQNLMFF